MTPGVTEGGEREEREERTDPPGSCREAVDLLQSGRSGSGWGSGWGSGGWMLEEDQGERSSRTSC